MRTELFDYVLPPELIAQTPGPRGQSRLLVIHRTSGQIEHRRFSDLPEYLRQGDTLVLNDTRVSARRLKATRESGLPAEVMLLRRHGDKSWEALVKPGKSLKPNRTVEVIGPGGMTARAIVTATTADGGRVLEFDDCAVRDALAGWGETPLPPYIHNPLCTDEEERYQTVYGRCEGSAAAPTAGLHFTPEMLELLERSGIRRATVTLHVGVGTFRPVRSESVEDHEMHSEAVELSTDEAHRINRSVGRVIAVGTTSTRTLETAALELDSTTREVESSARVAPIHCQTNLFITPGYRFRAIDGLITNFHLPKSTLLMLVSAFAGYETTRRAYLEAIKERYRFFSFGDAMLII